MKVHFSVTWGKNGLFNAGQRNFIMDWKQGLAVPRQGDIIDIPTFIEGEYTPDEVFMHENTAANVFDWIENTTGWEVEKLKWDYQDGSIILHVLITEKG